MSKLYKAAVATARQCLWGRCQTSVHQLPLAAGIGLAIVRFYAQFNTRRLPCLQLFLTTINWRYAGQYLGSVASCEPAGKTTTYTKKISRFACLQDCTSIQKRQATTPVIRTYSTHRDNYSPLSGRRIYAEPGPQTLASSYRVTSTAGTGVRWRALGAERY